MILWVSDRPVQPPGAVMPMIAAVGIFAAVLILAGTAPHVSVAAEEPSVDQPKPPVHPLEKTMQYAKSRQQYIRDHVRDYSCQLVKRERIGGALQLYHYALTKVRCERRSDGQVVQPMAVLMQFQKPFSIKGRMVLYVEGENDDMVLVRKGGRGAFKNVELTFDPRGTAAKRESNHPITDISLSKLTERLIERIQDDIEVDPLAANTEVSYRKAKVNGRECTQIQVEHPRRQEGFDYYQANLYVDDELKVPIALVAYDWPEKEADKPGVLEEYHYLDLKLNVGVPDDEFLKATYFDED